METNKQVLGILILSLLFGGGAYYIGTKISEINKTAETIRHEKIKYECEKIATKGWESSMQMKVHIIKIIAQNNITFPDCHELVINRDTLKVYPEYCQTQFGNKTFLQHIQTNYIGDFLSNIQFEEIVQFRSN